MSSSVRDQTEIIERKKTIIIIWANGISCLMLDQVFFVKLTFPYIVTLIVGPG